MKRLEYGTLQHVRRYSLKKNSLCYFTLQMIKYLSMVILIIFAIQTIHNVFDNDKCIVFQQEDIINTSINKGAARCDPIKEERADVIYCN